MAVRAGTEAGGTAGDPRAAPGDPLAGFSEPTAAWFRAAFAEPTPAQALAWQAIGAGEHTLVVAPTGSGKTLAAFLWAIDRLARAPALPGPVRLAAQGPRGGHRAEPPLPAGGRLPGHAPAGPARAGHHRGGPHRRHGRRRAAAAGEQAARHPDHDSRVAVPDAHLPGARRSARRADRDRRRDPRAGRD